VRQGKERCAADWRTLASCGFLRHVQQEVFKYLVAPQTGYLCK